MNFEALNIHLNAYFIAVLKFYEILAQRCISMNYILFEFDLKRPSVLHMFLIAKIYTLDGHKMRFRERLKIEGQ